MEEKCPTCVENNLHSIESFCYDDNNFDVFVKHMVNDLIRKYHDYNKMFFRLINYIEVNELVLLENIVDLNTIINISKIGNHVLHGDDNYIHLYDNLDYLIQKGYFKFQDIDFKKCQLVVSAGMVDLYMKYCDNSKVIIELIIEFYSNENYDNFEYLFRLGKNIKYTKEDCITIMFFFIKKRRIDVLREFIIEFEVNNKCLREAFSKLKKSELIEFGDYCGLEFSKMCAKKDY